MPCDVSSPVLHCLSFCCRLCHMSAPSPSSMSTSTSTSAADDDLQPMPPCGTHAHHTTAHTNPRIHMHIWRTPMEQRRIQQHCVCTMVLHDGMLCCCIAFVMCARLGVVLCDCPPSLLHHTRITGTRTHSFHRYIMEMRCDGGDRRTYHTSCQ